MLYNENAFTQYDHHEQGGTNEVEPASTHTPGSKPPRMDSQVELADAVQDELAAEDYFPALYSDDFAAQNGCGCGPESQKEDCGCTPKGREDDCGCGEKQNGSR